MTPLSAHSMKMCRNTINFNLTKSQSQSPQQVTGRSLRSWREGLAGWWPKHQRQRLCVWTEFVKQSEGFALAGGPKILKDIRDPWCYVSIPTPVVIAVGSTNQLCHTSPADCCLRDLPENNTWDRRFAVSLVQHLGAMGHAMLMHNNYITINVSICQILHKPNSRTYLLLPYILAPKPLALMICRALPTKPD